MTMDKRQVLSGMTTRQKVTAVALILVVAFLVWQVFGMFRGTTTTTKTAAPANTTTAAGGAHGPNQPPMVVPQQAQLIKPEPAPPTPREMELMKLQQETQAKYIAALNELQMLKVSREIAETNQAIVTAKLATVTAEKGIVDLLTAPAQPSTPAAYAQGLVNPTATAPITPTENAPPSSIQPPAEANYTVVSVSQLQYRWSAVLGYQGNLYNVMVGDVLPADGSKVLTIDKSGVLLEKNGVKKKVSLVPII